VTVRFDECRRAFMRQTRARFLAGEPLELLEQMLTDANAARFLELVAHIPGDLGPKLAMEWCSDRIDDRTWTPAAAIADERDRLERRADELRERLRLAAYDDAGRAELEAELYRCVDALSTLPFEEAL
jgi:hypothetical protein